MRFSLFLSAAFLAVASVPAACQQLPDPTVAWTASSAEVPFHLYQGNRVVAAGQINGHPVEFLLDTGAGATTIDKRFARSIGIAEGQKIEARGAGGMSEAELVSGVTLTLGGIKLTDVTAVVIDLSGIEKAIGRPMNVVLGRELFDHAVVGLDWEKGRLSVVEPTAFKPSPSARAVKLENDGTFNYTSVSIAGLPPVKAVLDLGNGGALSMPETYWSKHSQLNGLRYADSISGGVGGQHASRVVTLPSVEFAGQRFSAVPATLSGPRPAGAVTDINLGIGMLKPFKVTMDLGSDRLYLEPLAKFPAFVRDRSGLKTMREGGRLAINHVSPQGPAHAAGLKAGDVIVAIDGTSVSDGFAQGTLVGWGGRDAGTNYLLTLADGRTVNLTLADYY